jgi:hypothetical protein
MAKIGRPDVTFKPDRVEAIFNDIKEGVPYQIATVANGVHFRSWQRWVDKGLRDLLADEVTHHAEFVVALNKIESSYIKKRLLLIEEEKGNRGAEWILERKFWKYFSPRAIDIEVNSRLEKLEDSSKEAEENGGEVDSKSD